MSDDLRIRLATEDDAEGMLAIYAPVVRETAISFELEPPSVEEFRGRIRATLAGHPWLVCEIEGHYRGVRLRFGVQVAGGVSVVG